MADHGTTLSKLMAGRKVSSGTTESRVNQFKSDVKKGFRAALSSMDTKKSDAPKAAPAKAAATTAPPKKKRKNLIERAFSGAMNNIRKIEEDENRRQAYRNDPTKRPRPKSDAPKTAAKPEPAKAASNNNGRGDRGGRSGSLKGNSNQGNFKRQDRITTVEDQKKSAAAKKPEAKKPAAEKPKTKTAQNNKVSAERRKTRRKSSDSKYNEKPGGGFDFSGAINRQLTGR